MLLKVLLLFHYFYFIFEILQSKTFLFWYSLIRVGNCFTRNGLKELGSGIRISDENIKIWAELAVEFPVISVSGRLCYYLIMALFYKITGFPQIVLSSGRERLPRLYSARLFLSSWRKNSSGFSEPLSSVSGAINLFFFFQSFYSWL